MFCHPECNEVSEIPIRLRSGQAYFTSFRMTKRRFVILSAAKDLRFFVDFLLRMTRNVGCHPEGNEGS